MPQWASLVIGSLLTLVGGAFTSIISTQLTLKRFYAEKWWTLKVDAYSRIIEALHHAAHCCSEWSDEELGATGFSEEKKKQLSEDFSKALRELEIAAGVGAYVITTEVADVLAKLITRPKKFDPATDPWFEIYSADSKAYGEALEKVRVLAKADLKIS